MANSEDVTNTELTVRTSGEPTQKTVARPAGAPLRTIVIPPLPGSRASPVAAPVPDSTPAEGTHLAGRNQAAARRAAVLAHTTQPATMPIAAPFEPRRRAPPLLPPAAASQAPVEAGDASDSSVLVIASSVHTPIQVIAPAPRSTRPPPPPVVPRGGATVTTQTRSPPPVPRRDPAPVRRWHTPSSPVPTTTQVWSAPGPAAPVFVDPATNDLSGSTLRFVRAPKARRLSDRLWLPLVLIVLAGVVIGGFVLVAGRVSPRSQAPVGPSPSPRDVPSAAPAAISPSAPRLATTPIVAPGDAAEAPVIAAAPAALVEVRIDSKPSGATVALIDRGKSQLLGTTPIAASVDPSRTYELVFTTRSSPARVERLDPRTTRRVSVVLSGRRR